ncbi:MAG: glycosyltransferase, partial [Elainellaceae cyanobacterium]
LDVLNGRFTPSVDVLIPTYDEPAFILKRTVVGCQAMDYPHKTVYLLDDTHRPEIKALAQELGCQYMTRPNNLHAKAGNLNHAIAHTEGELILIFDADFIPTRNFLTRTVGFFQRPKVAMVQTPQTFYNPDPIAHNLGLEDILTPEEEVFYRQIQPMRDGAGGVICAGTSFVVRRSALEALGGFVTESLSEDYFTGVRLAAERHQLVYLDEKLSAGLAAESIATQALQRIRWAQGTLQAFFISSSPLTVRGLRPLQRLAHLEGILYWFTSLARLTFLIIPLVYLIFGLVPIYATIKEALYFFVPYYLVQIAVFSWLNHQSRSALLSELYSLILCFPLASTVIKSFIQPFGNRFKVTPKGTSCNRYTFNWALAYPLIVMFGVTAVSFIFSLTQVNFSAIGQAFNLGWVWSVYNLAMLGISLFILCDAPRPYIHNWFNLRRTVSLSLVPEMAPAEVVATGQLRHTPSHIDEQSASQRHLSLDTQPEDLDRLAQGQTAACLTSKMPAFWGVTTMLSEGGAELELTSGSFPTVRAGLPLRAKLMLMEDGIALEGKMTRVITHGEFPIVRVRFEPLSLTTYRRLIEVLYCRPGQWKSRRSPNEWQSFLLLFQILLRPRFLFDRQVDIKAVQVAQS